MSLLALVSSAAFAAGSCPDGQITLDGVLKPDLASALAAASAGSTIRVCAGTYVGTFVATVPVNLVAPKGPEHTVLDGVLAGTVLTLPGGSSLSGFTVTGGKSATDGGGLYVTSAGETTIEECAFTGNDATNGGGAVFAPDGAILNAWDSVFSGNTATYGGGFLVGARANSPRTTPILGVTLDLDGSVVSGNTARGRAVSTQNGWGGGILAYDATIYGGEVTGNQALNARSGFVTYVGLGGGMSLVGTSAVYDSRVIGNTSAGGGGGIQISSFSTAELDGVEVEDNVSLSANGGGVYAGGTVQVFANDTDIRGNHSARNGGGVELSGNVTWSGGDIRENTASNGGGIFVSGGDHTIEDVRVRENVATYYGGGAGGNWYNPVFGYTLAILGSEFKDNVAQNATGGALDLAQPTTIVDSVFKGNVAQEGGAMALYGWYRFSATPMAYTLIDVSIKNNDATVSGGGIWITDNAGVTLTDSDIKDNTAPVAGGVNLYDGVLTGVDSPCKNNDPDDIWVTDVSTAYDHLDAYTCTNAGCTTPDDAAAAFRTFAVAGDETLLLDEPAADESASMPADECWYDYGDGRELEAC